MAGMRMVTRAAWRLDVLGFLVLGLVAGLGVGFATTALSGARRADTAYTRLRTVTRAPDRYLDPGGLNDTVMARINRAPGVAGAGRFRYTPVAAARLGGPVAAFAALDPEFLTRVYRPLVVDGRQPDPGAIDEVVVNEVLARHAHLRPGDRLLLRRGTADGPAVGRVTVVAVGRGPFDFGPSAGQGILLLPHGFVQAHGSALDLAAPANAVLRSTRGTAPAALARSLHASVGRPVATQSAAGDAATIDRTLAVESIGLGVLGTMALVATLAAAVQFLSRRSDRPLGDIPALVAMGFRPRRRVLLGAILALPSAMLACAVTVAVSTLASPLVPTGFARTVDPVRGIHVDATMVLATCGVVASVLIGAGALIGRRHRAVVERPPLAHDLRLAQRLAPAPRLGLRAALAPARAPDGAAARGALITTAVAVSVVVAVLAFDASLHALLNRPVDYGWSFDAAISGGDRPLRTMRPALAGLSGDPKVARARLAAVVNVLVDGRQTEGYALVPAAGSVHPTLRSGRAPETDSEVALGRDLARTLHVDLGARVNLQGDSGRVRVVIVGIATFPELGNNADLATAISLSLRTARRIGAPESGGLVLIRLAPGATTAALRHYRNAGEVLTPTRPPRVRNLERVGGLPFVLAGFLAALGLLAIVHGLWRTVRGRRREFAVLAAIGFRPRDLRAAVRWQAVAVVALALAVGVPMGLLLGRTAWTAVADATGAVDRLVVPVTGLGLVLLGTVTVAILAGLAAGRAVTRAAPGPVLRSE